MSDYYEHLATVDEVVEEMLVDGEVTIDEGAEIINTVMDELMDEGG